MTFWLASPTGESSGKQLECGQLHLGLSCFSVLISDTIPAGELWLCEAKVTGPQIGRETILMEFSPVFKRKGLSSEPHITVGSKASE